MRDLLVVRASALALMEEARTSKWVLRCDGTEGRLHQNQQEHEITCRGGTVAIWIGRYLGYTRGSWYVFDQNQ